jgi:hypothetical protein
LDELSQARLDKPEMPECVRELVGYVLSKTWNAEAKSLASAVRNHYAPPFKIDKLGVYSAVGETGEWFVFRKHATENKWFANSHTNRQAWFRENGESIDGDIRLTKFIRPLEG